MSNDLRLPSYNTPPCETTMPFLIRPFHRYPLGEKFLRRQNGTSLAVRLTKPGWPVVHSPLIGC